MQMPFLDVVQNGRNILTNNMNDKKYANLSIQWARWLLKSIGLWPQAPNASMLDKIFHRIINVICFGLILLLLIPCGLYAILEVEDVYNKIRLFGPLSFCIMAITKYYSLAYHEENIRKCFEQIKWDWKNVRHVEDRDVMVANDKFGRHLLTVCCYFAYGSFVFYYIAVPINVGRVTVEDENLTFIPHVFPVSRYVIDARYSPANEIFFIAQFFGGLLIHGVSAVTCSLATVFAVHAYGQMEVLMCWLKHLINGREDMCKTEDGRMVDIVKHHGRVLKFLTIIEKALRQVSLVEFSGCTLNLCLLGYYIITEYDVTSILTYTVILASFLFNIFIFCYIGELVADQWKMVGEASYMADWYRLPGKRKLNFVLIIAMSNSSKKLTAGNLIELSLNTFSDVIKTSFAFLNMLRTLI